MKNLNLVGKKVPKLCCALCFVLCAGVAEPIGSNEEIIADYFYKLNADPKNPKKKINHSKGFCASGEFIPNETAASRFNIPLLTQKGEVKARFSLGGGNEKQSDNSKVRAMALKIDSNGEQWEMAMTNARVTFSKNATEFIKFFDLQLQQKNKSLTAEQIAAERAKVASFVNFSKEVGSLPITPSFANNAYHSVHAYFFEEKNGKKPLAARFSFVPKSGVLALNEEELKKLGDSFLEKNFKKEVKKAPIEFELELELANAKDDLKNTSALWMGEHKKIPLGTLKISKFEGYGCNKEVFMPGVLPSGILEPKDDIFELRNSVYAITFGRRQ